MNKNLTVPEFLAKSNTSITLIMDNRSHKPIGKIVHISNRAGGVYTKIILQHYTFSEHTSYVNGFGLNKYKFNIAEIFRQYDKKQGLLELKRYIDSRHQVRTGDEQAICDAIKLRCCIKVYLMEIL